MNLNSEYWDLIFSDSEFLTLGWYESDAAATF